MPKILNTDGNTITSTTSQFERYDIIRYSQAQPDDPVSLMIGNRGALDLARELGAVSAFITASDKGNRIRLGSGNDTIYGGLGYDSLYGAGGDDRIFGMVGDDILFGGVGADRLEGRAGEDRLFGGAGNDSLLGDDGNDTLVGGLGQDRLYGGVGNDVYIVDADDVIYEELDEGIDTVRSSVRWELSANVENLVLTGRDTINGFGNELDNILTGNRAYNYLNGMGGFDTLIGGRHGDFYELGDVSNVGGSLEFDRIVERADGGKDTVSVSSELGRLTYVIDKNIENAVVIGDGVFNVVGNELDNEITGNMWSNVLNGGAGDDILNGQGGFDTLIGGKGDDTYRLLTASLAPSTSYILDEVLEQPDGGIDTLLIGTGGDFRYYVMPIGVENAKLRFEDSFDLIGNSLANQLSGNGAANTLIGLGGNDVLDGAGGQNVLIGGDGNDRLISHGTADRIVMDEALNARVNVDRIIGFGDADSIELDFQIFAALSKGTLLDAEFKIGEQATSSLEHIIFSRRTGNLYYDEDGSGREARILFARLDAGADLSASDFLIV